MVAKSISTLTRHGKFSGNFYFVLCTHVSQVRNAEMQVIKSREAPKKKHNKNFISERGALTRIQQLNDFITNHNKTPQRRDQFVESNERLRTHMRCIKQS